MNQNLKWLLSHRLDVNKWTCGNNVWNQSTPDWDHKESQDYKLFKRRCKSILTCCKNPYFEKTFPSQIFILWNNLLISFLKVNLKIWFRNFISRIRSFTTINLLLTIDFWASHLSWRYQDVIAKDNRWKWRTWNGFPKIWELPKAKCIPRQFQKIVIFKNGSNCDWTHHKLSQLSGTFSLFFHPISSQLWHTRFWNQF